VCDLALLALALIDRVSFDFDEAVVLDAIQMHGLAYIAFGLGRIMEVPWYNPGSLIFRVLASYCSMHA